MCAIGMAAAGMLKGTELGLAVIGVSQAKSDSRDTLHTERDFENTDEVNVHCGNCDKED